MRRSLLAVFVVAVSLAASCTFNRVELADEATSTTTTPASTGKSTTTSSAASGTVDAAVETFAVPAGSRPHDVAPAPDGTVWYTAQATGKLGRLNPSTGKVEEIALGAGSQPHGVIVGPDGAAWVTDGGLHALVRVDPVTKEVEVMSFGSGGRATPHTGVFAPDGTLWFTDNGGSFGWLAADGDRGIVDSPEGPGPYGITATPAGEVYYASLAGSHIARIDTAAREATVIEPPTPDQGTRRVWSDSGGRIWCSQWNAGQVAVYDPADRSWQEWKLPGAHPQAYAVYVDDDDKVWLSDFGANAIVRFDPVSEAFQSFPLPDTNAAVRQLLGRPGEVWGAESGADKLVVVRVA